MFIESLKPMPTQALQERFASSEPVALSARRPSRLDLNRMFEENEILTQIKALRQEVGTRLDDMDQRLRKIEADIASPSIQGFGARLEEMDERLRRVESQYQQPTPGVLPPVGKGISALAARQEYVPAAPAPKVPTSTVVVTINPLFDVSRVRVVEGSLIAIDGVEAVTLQTLSGNSAELQVEIQENVSLIGGLRRTLPLAFDVSESEDSSFTIALAESVAEPQQDDAVVQKAQ